MLANTLASSGAGGGDCLADLRAVRWLPNACCPDAYGRCVSASDISQRPLGRLSGDCARDRIPAAAPHWLPARGRA
jgi:hypothetical protein